ncbi:hypothetical protein CWI36_0555p0020 [Hamiltosporidium magnivora]|uniref:Uncharacterized protein n=1 Tax=Hamiltosporidium magnivora TaxID=148818 RepID=A0A4Q9LE99_9MICR|nr:hypothetical protein CWI36_0555p0020 [Hamiltosporidium magnivora]
MSFWRTKTFRISTIIVLGLIIVGLLIGGIGYYKATNAIKDFERDFKNVSKTEQFKNHLSKVKNANIAFFLILEGFKIFWIVDPKDNIIKIFKKNEALGTDKTPKQFQINYSMDLQKIERASNFLDLFSFEQSGFTKILPNLGFLAKIGLKFKRKHSIKDIYNAVKIFDNELNRQLNFKQRTFLVLEIIGVKNIIVYKLHMKHGENTFLGVSTALTFESLKINDEVYFVSDFITYIAEKVYKEATTDAILNEFKKIFNINA